MAKIKPKRQGPYTVIIAHPSGVQYTVQRVGSRKNDQLKIRVDHMRRLNRLKEDADSASVNHQAKPSQQQPITVRRLTLKELVGEGRPKRQASTLGEVARI